MIFINNCLLKLSKINKMKMIKISNRNMKLSKENPYKNIKKKKI